MLAHNLGSVWRRLVLPKRIENWSLTSLQQRLVKTDGRLIKHAGDLQFPWRVVEKKESFPQPSRGAPEWSCSGKPLQVFPN